MQQAVRLISARTRFDCRMKAVPSARSYWRILAGHIGDSGDRRGMATWRLSLPCDADIWRYEWSPEYPTGCCRTPLAAAARVARSQPAECEQGGM